LRLPALLTLLTACTSGGAVPDGLVTEASPRGPDMVRVPGGSVRLGMKRTPPVPGFSPGSTGGGGPAGPQGQGATGGNAPSGPQGPPGVHTPPPSQGAPQGPPIAPGGPPRMPGGGPAAPVSAPGPAASPSPAAPFVPVGPGELPDRGLARGAVRDLSRSPVPDPLDPARIVEVPPFWIDLTEVTQAQYAEFLADTGYRPPYVDEEWAGDGWDWDGATPPADTRDHPVVLVNWHDARAYCGWAGKRLPTESEWQLAVLGPADDERPWPWGNDYDPARLNHGTLLPPNYDDSDGYERTSPVGSFPRGASRYGLQDGFGNAWEWTADHRVGTWDQILGERRGDTIVDPHTAPSGLYAAVRGGAYFFDFRPNPAGERSAFLDELRRKSSGFRCARDA
jgi:formylglycine-generating enzyme required for sulfatase activity